MNQEKRRWLKGFVFGFAPGFIVATAAKLDLFSHLKGPRNLEEIVKETGLPARPLRMILDALCALGLLKKEGSFYFLSPDLDEFLGRGDVFSYEAYLSHGFNLVKGWLRLPEAISGGHPEPQGPDPEFFTHLTRGLLAVNWPEATELAGHLKSRGYQRLLDVGAGSCLWSAALLKELPSAQAWAIDFPQVLDGSAQEIVRHLHLEDRFVFLPGNYWEISWGEGYDLIILGHICHSLGPEENVALFKKARQSLARDGELVIIEFIPDEGRCSPLFPLIFALNMLLHTDSGDTYTASEYQDFLARAGLKISERLYLDQGHGSQVIVARAE